MVDLGSLGFLLGLLCLCVWEALLSMLAGTDG